MKDDPEIRCFLFGKVYITPAQHLHKYIFQGWVNKEPGISILLQDE